MTTALTFEIDAIRAGKSERLNISISTPYDTRKGSWACLFELRGIKDEEESCEYFGADGLQTLILNLYYLRFLFTRLRKDGYIFRDLESGEEIDPDNYFDVFTGKNA